MCNLEEEGGGEYNDPAMFAQAQARENEGEVANSARKMIRREWRVRERRRGFLKRETGNVLRGVFALLYTWMEFLIIRFSDGNDEFVYLNCFHRYIARVFVSIYLYVYMSVRLTFLILMKIYECVWIIDDLGA